MQGNRQRTNAWWAEARAVLTGGIAPTLGGEITHRHRNVHIGQTEQREARSQDFPWGCDVKSGEIWAKRKSQGTPQGDTV